MLVSDGGERRMIHASTWWVSVASAPWEDQSQGLQLSPTLASVWRMVISRSCRMMSLSLSLSLSRSSLTLGNLPVRKMMSVVEWWSLERL